MKVDKKKFKELSILLKSYWNIDKEISAVKRVLAFNSSKVLLELGEGLTPFMLDLQTFNSSKVLLEPDDAGDMLASDTLTFNSSKVLLERDLPVRVGGYRTDAFQFF